jgi:hypothetical protein
MIKPRKKKRLLHSKPILFSCFIIAVAIIASFYPYPITKNGRNQALHLQEPQISEPISEPTLQEEPEDEPSVDQVEQPQSTHSQQVQKSLKETSEAQLQPQLTKDNFNTVDEEVILSEQQSTKKLTIDKLYESEISTLRSECRAKSSKLLQSIIGELTSNEEATLMTLKNKFLGKLLIAEANCDNSFQSLISKASADYKEADIPVTMMPSWKNQYSKEKAAVRASAIAKLAAAIK